MDRTFPLFDLLIKGPVEFEEDDGGLFLTARNPHIDIERVTHFGMAIFWKASAHTWRSGAVTPLIDLGPHSEGIRKWVLGEGAFPKDVVLWVGMSRPDKAQITLNRPVMVSQSTKAGGRSFMLHTLDLFYFLHIGDDVSLQARATCFHHHPGHPISVSDHVSDRFAWKLAGEYAESRKTTSFLKS